MDIRDKFVIHENKGNVKPYYVLRYEMDSNDGDYIRDSSSYSEEEWKNQSNFFFLMLSYLSRGYSGKFSHGKDWGSYYGHHLDENKHGLSEEIEVFTDRYDIMCYSDWGSCHSFTNFTLEYYDSEKRKHDVDIPNIDDFFETEEDMVKTIKDACKEYLAEDEVEGEETDTGEVV